MKSDSSSQNNKQSAEDRFFEKLESFLLNPKIPNRLKDALGSGDKKELWEAIDKHKEQKAKD